MSMIGSFMELTPSRLATLLDSSDEIEGLLFDDEAEGRIAQFDVDKAWHGMHFLLTGKSWGGDGPEAMAVLGGEPVGEDLGYGPARYVTPAQVAEIAKSLEAISRDQLQRRFVPAELEKAEIYPQGTWEDEGLEAFEYLMQGFEELVSFYRQAAANGNAVLLYLS